MILLDLLENYLSVVFCGTAVGNTSARQQAYYARRGNSFYPTLFACGLTPHTFEPQHFRDLLHHSIGLSDLAKMVHGNDKNIKNSDYDTAGFQMKILQYRPKIVCFNGKEAAMHFLHCKSTREVSYGWQAERIGEAKIFVAPSTSSQGKSYWDISWWHQLSEAANQMKNNSLAYIVGPNPPGKGSM